MEAELRRKKLEELSQTKPIGTMPVWYQNDRQILPVHQIDLSWLVYNPYNGRISSYVKSYEREKGINLDTSNPDHAKIIADFLWNSNVSRNQKTEQSLRDQGQMKYGIVTKDGFIIDGNRRASILNKIYKEDAVSPGYFFAVILNEKLNDNPQEIRRLETTYQLGQDDILDYNPIQKYLKCKDLIVDFSAEEIAGMMNEDAPAIKENLEIMDLMDQYLDYLNYSGIYTRLDNTEDLFINLNTVLKRWKTSQSQLKWKVEETDLSDLQLICYDLIRYVYNSPKGKGINPKNIREKIIRNSQDTFVANEEIWKTFSERHRQAIEPLEATEKSVDDLRAENPTRDLSSLLKSRDEAWAKSVDASMKENFGLASAELDNLQSRGEPLKLLRAALSKLETVDSVSESRIFLEDNEVFGVVDAIRKLSDELKRKIVQFNKRNR